MQHSGAKRSADRYKLRSLRLGILAVLACEAPRQEPGCVRAKSEPERGGRAELHRFERRERKEAPGGPRSASGPIPESQRSQRDTMCLPARMVELLKSKPLARLLSHSECVAITTASLSPKDSSIHIQVLAAMQRLSLRRSAQELRGPAEP